MFHYRQEKPNNTIASRRRVFQQSATKTALESLKLQNGEFSISSINMLFIFYHKQDLVQVSLNQSILSYNSFINNENILISFLQFNLPLSTIPIIP